MIRANVLQADFAHNFRNAVGSMDKELTDDLILNEIASLIESKPLTIIQIMSMFGYKFVGSTRGDLVKAVTELLQASPKFRVALSMLIALNNGVITLADVQNAGIGDLTAFKAMGGNYHNDSAKEGGGGGGAIGGGDMVTSIINAVSGITSGSLNLAAAKANQKSTQIAASSGLEQAKINAEATGVSAAEATKQELLRTLGIKASSAGSSGLPGWVIGAIGLLIVGIIGFVVVNSNSKQGTMPAIQPAASSSPPAHSAPAVSPSANMPAHATGGQVPPLLTTTV